MIIFLIEMAVATRIAAKFNSYYAEKPGRIAHTSRTRHDLKLINDDSAHDYGHQRCKP